MEGKKFIVGLVGVIVLLLVGGVYKVTILDDRIIVSLPSDVCNAATLRVTKDDFTLKCGGRIAFQADTIVEYWRTYGQNEKGEEAWWVRNNRFVGLNKKHITLELNDYGNYFDITRRTRYRKGRQNIDDGILHETYTFTKDKVKISYDYEVANKALHRISMRIKKQVGSYLDASDPFGHTGVQTGNLLYYEGFGNLLIDPTIRLHSPANFTTNFNEGDTISFKCSCNQTTNITPTTLTNISLWWNVDNESNWRANETTALTVANTTVTYTRVIPHPVTTTFPGTFIWSCECCNNTQVSGINCSFPSNYSHTVDPRYIPEVPTIISPNDSDINLLNGSGPDWNLQVHYPGLGNFSTLSSNQSIWVNWSVLERLRDNNTGITLNLSYFGILNTTRKYDNFHGYNNSDNLTVVAQWNISNLDSDRYFITLTVCNEFNTSLCSSTTTSAGVDIFDYAVNITTGETKIRFSPQPTITKGAALGQTASQGIIQIDWLGSSFPDGQVNLSINLTAADKCITMFVNDEDNSSTALTLTNQSYVTGINASGSDPDYIWLYATKVGCGTTTLPFIINLDFFFGGNLSVS